MSNELSNLIRNVISRVSYIAGEDDNIAKVDPTADADAIVNIDIIHNRIHRGQFFSVDFLNIALADDAILEMLIRVPAEKSAHTRVLAEVGGDARQTFLENPTITDDGASLTPINRNRFSSLATDILLFSGPTVTVDGTVLQDTIIAAGRGPLSGGGGGGTFEEYVLNPGDYVYRVKNISGNVQPASIQIDFYENIIAQP